MRNVSLRLLGILAMLVVLMLGAVITYGVMMADAREAFFEAQAEAKQDAEAEFTSLLSSELDVLTRLAEKMILLGQLESADSVGASSLLGELWRRLQFSSSITHLGLLSESGQEFVFGDHDTLVRSQMALESVYSQQSVSQLDCESLCVLATAVPVLIEGKKWSLTVTSDIGDLLVDFSQFTRHDIALLSSAPEGEAEMSLGPWRVSSITGGQNYGEMITGLNSPAALDVLSEGIVSGVNGAPHYVWQVAFPQTYGATAEFLFIHDLSEWSADYESRKNFLLTFVIALSIGLLFAVAIITLKPMQRLAELVSVVKLLGQQDYQAVEKVLRNLPSRYFRDEIDIVEDAVGEAVNKLKTYEDEIQSSKSKLHQLAMKDSITNLYNRNAFITDLSNLKRENVGAEVAILFIDLDGFKPVNDNLGHEAGDQVLHILGGRLNELSSETVFVCRLGGDEFAIRMVGFSSRDDVFHLIEKLFSKFALPIQLGDMSVEISASIGVAFSLTNDEMFDDLLRHADMAMYQAKRAGKNGFRVFDDSMETESSMQFRVKQDFAEALERSQLYPVFQPIVDVSTRQLTKLEGLTRWHHPELGLLSPALFIPVLEESGQIAQLTRWITEQALLQVVKLDKLGLEGVRVAVNISGQQVTDASYVEQLYRRCKAAGVDPARLELEITETSLIRDFQRAKAWVDEVNRCGFKVAIDDFGTGYSSLSYLTSIPFDTVKLDRSLLSDVVSDPTQQKVVASIGQMLHSLGVGVVAEGIETSNQFNMLSQLHCDHAQGFLLATPMGTAELDRALSGYQKRGTWYNATETGLSMASPLGIEPRSKP